MSGSPAPTEAPGRCGHFGAWRAVTAVPAMVGSLLGLVLLFGGLGRWQALVLLGWLAAGVAMLTRIGERIAVRAACRFRRPTPAQVAMLRSPWATALRMSGTAAGEVELYVQHARKPNAYAAGRRSVAVTSRVLEEYRAGRLSEDQLVAVMVHELGHHVTRATRPMLFTVWLAAPWRVAARLVIYLASALPGRQSRYGVAMVVFAGVAVAVGRALYEGHWLVGGVLLFVGLSAVLCPLADAAVTRRAEFAADRFAADHGLAPELSAALHALDGGQRKASGWSGRLLASHPTCDERIGALLRATAHARA